MAQSPDIKRTHTLFRVITRETERLLDRTLGRGYASISQDILRMQVALNTGQPIREAEPIVDAYISSRADLHMIKGIIKKRKHAVPR
jgi:hypothetical protein